MDLKNITWLDLHDKEERRQIRTDLKGVLANHGVELDDSLQYVVITDSATTCHFAIPSNAAYHKMSENALHDLAAAGTVSTVSTGATVSSCLGTASSK